MDTYTVFVIDGDFRDFENLDTAFLHFYGLSAEDVQYLAGLSLGRGMDVVIRLETDEEEASCNAASQIPRTDE